MGNLNFVFGPSGSGKTTEIYKDILERAKKEPSRNFLIIVPDQFTMQTQWDLANMSPDGGILNIDVLSFGRLTHRILEEVGWENYPVLDDTGKCLIMQKVGSDLEKELKLLGSKIHRQGYIHEIKSVLSEFMQYSVSPEDIDKIIDSAKGKGALQLKLKDLQVLYRGYREYIAGKYISREDKLTILREALPKSAILPDSVVVFDGFTGFTPIQLDVIEDLMPIVSETIVSLILGAEAEVNSITEQQDLFYLSAKTYRALTKRAKRQNVEVTIKEKCKFSDRAENIDYLEKKLFRNNKNINTKPVSPDGSTYPGITLMEMSAPSEEVHQVGLEVARLLRTVDGLKYRDIAIVTGDLATYGPYVEREFSKIGIPFYLDKTSGIRLNPMVEAIRSSLKVFLDDFSAEAVFRYLRSGLSCLNPEEVDKLEMYVRRTNIRGAKSWNNRFARKTRDMDKSDETELLEINELRERFVDSISALSGKNGKDKAANYVNRLYDFLVATDASGRLVSYAQGFAESGDRVREKEYSQIYKKVMELLEQIVNLIGDDEIDMQEFYEILDAGFGEIRVGTIPQTVDKIMVGDMERSRVSSTDIVFFLGVNDGNIPKNSDGGGLLSEIDREHISEETEGIELAPTPREAMFTQRLYLYMNLTKARKNLYLSWVGVDASGKAMRPSYLVEVMKKLFPGIAVIHPESRSFAEQIVTKKEGLRYLSEGLRQFAAGEISEEDNVDICTIYSAYENENSDVNRITESAFIKYDPKKIDSRLAEELYCDEEGNLYISVSKLESFSLCPYRYFLRYGLGLSEQESFEVSNLDTGNVFHSCLEAFSKKLREDNLRWALVSESYVRENVTSILEQATVEYSGAVFYDTKRTEYSIERMKKALVRAILTIKYQLGKSRFEPEKFETGFSRVMDIPKDALEAQGVEGAGVKKLKLVGKIDRVDVAEVSDSVYVRVVDYKSSSKDVKLSKVIDGTQIQLPLYTGQEVRKLKEKGKDAHVGGMLYFEIDEPIIETDKEVTKEELDQSFAKELKMKGLVTNDDTSLILHDSGFEENASSYASDVIPVTKNKDGNLSAKSKAVSYDAMDTIINYAERIALERGCEILGGKIDTNPMEGQTCSFCPFKKSCGFDRKISGYETRKETKLDFADALGQMADELLKNQ